MKGRKRTGGVSKKISAMVHEGYKQPVAVAAALNMERKGKLGPDGGYERKGPRRGPIGKMRRGTE